jgi:hypothetical protein
MSTVGLSKGARGGLYYQKNGKKVYVKNPNAPTYQMRRSAQPSTGWGTMAPKKGPERARLYEECDAKGKSCFLRPNAQNPGQSGFPVCPACRNPNVSCSCQPDCKGVVAAYVRARQWKYVDEAEKARAMEQKYKCSSSATSSRAQIGGMDSSLPGVLYDAKGRFSQSYCAQPPSLRHTCPFDQPLRYKMRGRNEYCCRASPSKRVGPRQTNPYTSFLSAHKGQGYSKEELLDMYNASK